MINCTGCLIGVTHKSDDEREHCVNRECCERAYQQGREDAIAKSVYMLRQASIVDGHTTIVTMEDVERIAEQIKEAEEC